MFSATRGSRHIGAQHLDTAQRFVAQQLCSRIQQPRMPLGKRKHENSSQRSLLSYFGCAKLRPALSEPVVGVKDTVARPELAVLTEVARTAASARPLGE